MDKRGREAVKRHRSDEGVKYVTASLMLDRKIFKFLKKEVNKTEDKNMSKFLEDIVAPLKIRKMPKRRKFGNFPVKKTFTFTEKFKKKIKKSGNMSLFVEEMLIEIFNLK